MLISEYYNTRIGNFIFPGCRRDSKLNLRSVRAGADADDVGDVMLQSLLIIICLPPSRPMWVVPPCLYLNLYR